MQDFNEFLKQYLSTQQVKSITFENAINLFINDFSKVRRPDTIRYYKEHLKPFENFTNLRQILYTHELTNDLIKSYMQYLKYQGNENITINKRISIIRLLMNWLYTKGYISKFELVFPKLEIQPKQITVINDKQLIELIQYSRQNLDHKQLLIVLLLISTGIRRNELVNIKISNIEFEKKRIYLDYTKSKKARYIFINDEMISLIKKTINSNSQKVYLLENKNGKIQDASYITGLLFYIKKKLDFKVLSPHKLRHTYATYLLKKGANQEEVRRLLGHTDFKMTKRYIDYIDNDLQIANEKFNPLNIIKK